MSQIENHLRDALTDVADEIPADGVPPLNLPDDPDNVIRLAGRWDTVRRRWLAPAAAAAAILAVATGIAVSAALPRPPHSTIPSSQQVPAYYIALPSPGSLGPVGIYATRTGRLVTTLRFQGDNSATLVTAAANGRTFVIVTAGKHPTLYLARFNGATRTAQVRVLHAPTLPAHARVEALALSPDGTKLAVGYRANVSDRSGKHVLVVTDLKTGQTRDWTSARGEFAFFYTVTWAADDATLAFNWFEGWQKSQSKPLLPGSGVRLLDTARPGSDLVASSRLALAYTAKPNPFSPKKDEATVSAGVPAAPWLTPDGKTIVFPVIKLDLIHAGFASYSAATGKLERTFGNGSYDPTSSDEILWVSRDGKTLVVYGAAGHADTLGILRGDHFRSLPTPPGTLITSSGW
jgi:Tol biopolymer transport system component